MTTFPKPTPGAKIAASGTVKSAGWVSAVSESAQHYHEQKRLGDAPQRTGLRPPVVKVQNKTGGNLARGSVVELGAYLLTTNDRHHLWFEGDTYATGVPAILDTALVADKIGGVRTTGVAIARVNVNDTGHEFAQASAGSTVLQSAQSGPVQIITAPSGAGVQELMVHLGGGGEGASSDHPLITVYNNTADDWPVGAIVWPYLPITPAASQRIHSYQGKRPYGLDEGDDATEAPQSEPFCVMLQAVPKKETGEEAFSGLAAITGLRYAKVHVRNSAHNYAAPLTDVLTHLVSVAEPDGLGTVPIFFKPGTGNTVDCIVDMDQRNSSGGGESHFVCIVLDANPATWNDTTGQGSPGSATLVLTDWDGANYIPRESTTAAQWFGGNESIATGSARWGLGFVASDGRTILQDIACQADEFEHGLDV